MSMRAFVLLACLAAAPAKANPIPEIICAPTGTMYTRLSREYLAERRGTGMRAPDQIMEIWEAPSTGEWTLLMTYANGRSCIVAMGEDWYNAPKSES
ncbi:hypothetical protein [Pseudoruegeria sp. HB172150]|uniref:hypothetical protein n=1 Tax=Pseudoruegeria sp. HB172150 TaxID=2721164 RepID=UPI0015531F3D|nr:hypothetical protein [Pseudoruegeria sp. HB172150]